MLKKLLEPYKGLNRSVYIIFVATILNNLGNFVGPVITLLLTYKMGVDVKIVGLAVAVNGMLGLFGALIGGKWVDRYGRKIIFVIFRSIAAFAFIICAYIDNPYIMIAILMFGSFTSGITAPVFNTMITDVTEPADRKQAFSLRYMGINVGYAVGPIIAVYLYYQDYMRLLFLGDAATMLLSILMIVFFVPESMPEMKKLHKKEEISTLVALKSVPILLWFSVVIMLYFVVFSQFNFGLSLTVKDTFMAKGELYYGYMMGFNAVLCSVFTILITDWTKNIKPARSIQFGGILYTIGFGMMAFINSVPMFFISTFVWTIGEILVAINTSVIIANQSPTTHRGRFNAIFPMIRRIGFFVGPILSGIVIDVYNLSTMWMVIGALAFGASLLMGGINKKINAIETEEEFIQKEVV